MKKRILSMALLFGLLSGMSVAAHAETIYGSDGWKVTFTENNAMESTFQTNDLDDVIYGLQPGDTAVVTLQLENNNATTTDWYMTNQVLSSLEDSSDAASGGAYTYILTYTDSAGEVTTLFSSDTVGGDSTEAGEGLHEADSALSEYFYLDTLALGDQGTITLTVALDGETQGNDYQDTLADLQMNFAVELNAPAETTPDTSNEGNNSNTNNNNNTGSHTTVVKTGDEMELTPFIVAAAISGLLLLFLAIYGITERKKQQDQKKEVP
jgi:molybdopterin converting factor small subunit